MRTSRFAVLLFATATAGCAGSAPFSISTPGLETLRQEEPHFYAAPTDAADALSGMPLGARVQNVISSYEEELGRAQRAQGGFLNTILSVLGIALPISGTASAVALSDPDQVQTVAIVSGAATTAILALNLLLRPEAKSAAAANCASFLESALESYRQRWDPARLDAVGDTPEEWRTYLTMRATLEPGRRAACGD